MARELKLYVNADEGKFVAAFDSSVSAILPKFILGDQVPVSVRILTKAVGDASRPWQEADLTGQNIRIAIGKPAGPPSSGTFTLETDGDETTALAYNANAAAVQSALNALASVTSAGGVTVTNPSTGVYRVVYNDPGARDPFTAGAASLYPSVDATILTAQAGDVDTQQVELIRFETQPASYVELEDELPVASAAVEIIRAGATDISEIQSLALSPEPYDGTYTLAVGSEETSAISYNALPDEIESALEALTGVGVDTVTVTGTFPRYTIEFDATLAAVGAIVPDVSGLVVPTGRKGVLSTNTTGIVELLNGAAQASAKLEIEIFDTSESSAWTVVQADCTVIDDVIGGTPSASTGGPVYPTVPMVEGMIEDYAMPLPIALDDVPLRQASQIITVDTNTTSSWSLVAGSGSTGESSPSYPNTTAKAAGMAVLINADSNFPFTAYSVANVIHLVAKPVLLGSAGNGSAFSFSGTGFTPGGSTLADGILETATQLGQIGQVTVGGNTYSFRVTGTGDDSNWEGATPGLFFNPTLGEWRVMRLSGTDAVPTFASYELDASYP